MPHRDGCFRQYPCSVNELIYRTVQGGQVIQAGETFQSPTLDVRHYNEIRLVANNRTGSATNVAYKVTLIENQAERVGYLLEVSLAPGENFTEVIRVPGTTINVTVVADPGIGQDVVDFFVYGNKTLCNF